ncbi:hypothetical protein KIW84_071646 [Lathyrus oleraceus]|uniref:ATPase AAA-type core domain-containing protein n=1 Tax=Pisum sativum TaxID=3888 RepID=A0A9D4ZW45_PEA|nr:hypothetical protein KIW84_071646 [Pisum sativum]
MFFISPPLSLTPQSLQFSSDFVQHGKKFPTVVTRSFLTLVILFYLDVIGGVTDIIQTQINVENNKNKVFFVITDMSKFLVQCTLWDNLASQFYRYYNCNKDVDNVIVLLQNARIKGDQGARGLEKEVGKIVKEKNEAIRNQDYEKLRKGARGLEKEVGKIVKEKNEAIRNQDYEKLRKGARGLEKEVGKIVKEKNEAIRNQDYEKTGIHMEKVSVDESDRLIKMEETLHKRIIGQHEAVEAISRAIHRARVGLNNPNRPIASFIFFGLIGVRKSKLAKSLASYYFGSEEATIQLDMSEFMESHTISKLCG